MASKLANIRRGPSLSTRMPTKIRAGMVSATLRMSKAATSCLLRPKLSRIAAIKGAWLNHTTKLTKNATQLKCKMRIRGARLKNGKRGLGAWVIKISFDLCCIAKRMPIPKFSNFRHNNLKNICFKALPKK